MLGFDLACVRDLKTSSTDERILNSKRSIASNLLIFAVLLILHSFIPHRSAFADTEQEQAGINQSSSQPDEVCFTLEG